MTFDDLLKNERQFLKENDFEKNENNVYLFKSENGKQSISLDFILSDYKDWLIENKILKI